MVNILVPLSRFAHEDGDKWTMIRAKRITIEGGIRAFGVVEKFVSRRAARSYVQYRDMFLFDGRGLNTKVSPKITSILKDQEEWLAIDI